MSWMQRLAEVYDNNEHRVGKFDERYKRRFTLMPLAHVAQNAQIEILLTRSGDFHSAKVIPKEEASTIVPATLDSANRAGSKIAPHYVHDKLFYVAKDYKMYGTNRKRDLNFDEYEKQMQSWVNEGDAPERVEVITSYIERGTVIQDLIKANIIYTDAAGKVIEKWTAQDDEKYGIEKPALYRETPGTAFDALVRFDVLKENPSEITFWEDPEMFKSYEQYIQNFMEQNEKHHAQGVCYVTGEYGLLSTQHGSKLRHAGDQSKVISANDSSGYTYRGRFSKATEAAQIGYDISQKSHQALRWLNQRQSTNIDTRYFLTFGTLQPTLPDIFAGTKEIFGMNPVKKKDADTEEVFAQKVGHAIHGIATNFEGFYDNKIIIMALDAATSGRLAIVYYQEQEPKLFLEALIHWHTTCQWQLFYKDKETKKSHVYIGTPSTFEMAKAVYGERANSAVKKEFYTRILPCITERRTIPKDMIHSIFQRVIRPESFKGTMESWGQTLNIACAMIYKSNEKEVQAMTLQSGNMNRDYLFGRLLGVAEVLERRALQKQGEERSTNATRYFNAFANRPARSWLVIRKQLQPYFDRLGVRATPYQIILQEIESALGPEQMTDTALGPVFLTGYSSQVQSMYQKKIEEDETNDITK